VLVAYQGELRRPSTSIYLLDVSGSMKGERIEQLRKSLEVLTGAETSSISARFVRFQSRERVVLISFSSEPAQPVALSFDNPNTQTSMFASVHDYATRLEADGGTAIYSALDRAYDVARAERQRDPERFISVALLTDGRNTQGMDYREFRARLLAAQAQGGTVRTFPIVFGEASSDELEDVARLTGGRAFEGRNVNLAGVFKEIRGYQ
jgi:Ca-activated chloride channel homolog